MPILVDQLRDLQDVTLPAIGQAVVRAADVDGKPAFGGSDVASAEAVTQAVATHADDQTAHGLDDLRQTVDGKADAAAVTTALAGKANASHTHTLAAITDAGTAAARNVGTGSGQLVALGAGGSMALAGSLSAPSVTATGALVGGGTVSLTGTASFASNATGVQINGAGMQTGYQKTFDFRNGYGGTIYRVESSGQMSWLGEQIFGAGVQIGGYGIKSQYNAILYLGNHQDDSQKRTVIGDLATTRTETLYIELARPTYTRSTLSVSGALAVAGTATLTVGGTSTLTGRVVCGNTLGLATVNTGTTPGTVVGQVAWSSGDGSIVWWDGSGWVVPAQQ